MKRLLGSCLIIAVVGLLGAGVLGCNSNSCGLYGCAPVVTADAYETCDDRVDVCPSGLTCTPSTLPASAGFTGEFCSSGCNFSSDCLQLVSNYDAICVNQECYIQCPDGGAACPYGTGCAQFADQDGNLVNLCTP